MERMNPPPNYYGAMYPNGQQYPNGTNMTNPPPYSEEVPQAFKTAQTTSDTGVQDGYVQEEYIHLSDGIKSVKEFYKDFRENISDKIGSRVKIYCAFTDSSLWHDKIFEGTLISSADNYLLIKETDSNKYTIIASVYVIYLEMFDK